MEKAIKNLGKYIDDVYNNGSRWKIGKSINPTMMEVTQLYDVYKYIVHDKVKPCEITTISQNVADALKYFGFKLKEQGIGWVITE